MTLQLRAIAALAEDPNSQEFTSSSSQLSSSPAASRLDTSVYSGAHTQAPAHTHANN